MISTIFTKNIRFFVVIVTVIIHNVMMLLQFSFYIGICLLYKMRSFILKVLHIWIILYSDTSWPSLHVSHLSQCFLFSSQIVSHFYLWRPDLFFFFRSKSRVLATPCNICLSEPGIFIFIFLLCKSVFDVLF